MTLKELIGKINEGIAERRAKHAADIPTFVQYAAQDFFRAAEVAQRKLHVKTDVTWQGNRELMLFVWPSEENSLRALAVRAGSALDTRVPIATLTKTRVLYEQSESAGTRILVPKELVHTEQAAVLLDNTADEILQKAEAAIWASAAHIIKRANMLVELDEELGTERLSEIIAAAHTV